MIVGGHGDEVATLPALPMKRFLDQALCSLPRIAHLLTADEMRQAIAAARASGDDGARSMAKLLELLQRSRERDALLPYDELIQIREDREVIESAVMTTDPVRAMLHDGFVEARLPMDVDARAELLAAHVELQDRWLASRATPTFVAFDSLSAAPRAAFKLAGSFATWNDQFEAFLRAASAGVPK